MRVCSVGAALLGTNRRLMSRCDPGAQTTSGHHRIYPAARAVRTGLSATAPSVLDRQQRNKIH
jgi:hypothetical protein